MYNGNNCTIEEQNENAIGGGGLRCNLEILVNGYYLKYKTIINRGKEG